MTQVQIKAEAARRAKARVEVEGSSSTEDIVAKRVAQRRELRKQQRKLARVYRQVMASQQ